MASDIMKSQGSEVRVHHKVQELNKNCKVNKMWLVKKFL